LMKLEVIEIKKYKNPTTSSFDCERCYKCGHACRTHSWFFTICCGYVLLMALPRVLCILDFVITLTVFCTNVEGKLGEKFSTEISHFNFATASIDLFFYPLLALLSFSGPFNKNFL